MPRNIRTADGLAPFAELLSNLRRDRTIYAKPAYIALVHLATLGGKLSFDDADDSLVPFERLLLHALIGRPGPAICPVDECPLEGVNVIIKHSAFGKLAMYDARSAHKSPSDEVLIGTMSVDPAILDSVLLATEAEELIEAQLREPLDEMLSGWYEQGTLPDKVCQVQRWVNQFDALYTYVGRMLYSRAAGAISTLAEDGRFKQLLSHDPALWASEDRLFIAAAHVLTATGGPTRLEEFNGKQLTATCLTRWLKSKFQLYRIAGCGDRIPADGNILDLARSFPDLVRVLDKSAWVRFRRINGLSLVKKEHIFRPPPTKPIFDLTSEPSGHERSEDASDDTQLAEACAAISTLGMRTAEAASSTERAALIQDGLELLLLSAVNNIGADYVMSSGIRDPSRLRHDPAVLLMGPDALKRNDFYCCVLPAPLTATEQSPEALAEMLIAIARRMEYNRWHFIPGNYPDDTIPPLRHHFRPPLLPDLAEWSSLRHGGHIDAQVRYSLRLPGPPAWSDPALIYGRRFRGIYDLRVYRTHEPPFTSADLAVGLRYCSLLDNYMKAAYKTLEKSGYSGQVFDRYTSAWYREGRWQPSDRRVPDSARKFRGDR
jgi:hypothetical protein